MSAPELAILVFGGLDTLARQAVVGALPGTAALEKTVVHPMPSNPYGWATQGEPLILLAVGPEGGAALARWVAEHVLEGVAGVGLVGVTAPLAKLSAQGHSLYQGIDPLEPLRAVAERARRGEPCADCDGHGYYRGLDNTCDECGGHGREYPIRLIIACAPDDGVCAWCNGRAIVSINALWGGGGRRDVICHACTNGRALSSSDVARELISDADGQFGAHGDPLESYEWVSGGAIVICYERRAALDEHGLRAVVERLVR